MSLSVVSLSSIEDAMLSFLKTASLSDGTGAGITEFNARLGLEHLLKFPAVCCATESISFDEPDEETVTWSPTIMLYLIFKNVSNEKARRRGVYPIIEGCIRLLSLQTLGLDIEPLKPGPKADEMINPSLEARRLIGFKIPFTTEFDVSKYEVPQEAVNYLVSGIKYYLQPDDGVEDAEDIVSLSNED